jgi:tRNA uridine 5-carbamoylmethylation protein Kti12
MSDRVIHLSQDRIVPRLYLIRGLPGSGKTTYANKLGCCVISPSDFSSHIGGEYKWIRENYMKHKMAWRSIVRQIMKIQCDIAICEIMPEIKFINFWLDEAKNYYYEVHIKTLLVNPDVAIERNQHGADHKSIYEVHQQFDYTIVDQIRDYSNGTNENRLFLTTNWQLGEQIRNEVDNSY